MYDIVCPAHAHWIAARIWSSMYVFLKPVHYSTLTYGLRSTYSIRKTLRIHVIVQPYRRIHCTRAYIFHGKKNRMSIVSVCGMLLHMPQPHSCVFVARSAHKSKQRLSNLNKWKISFFHFEPSIKAVPTFSVSHLHFWNRKNTHISNKNQT